MAIDLVVPLLAAIMLIALIVGATVAAIVATSHVLRLVWPRALRHRDDRGARCVVTGEAMRLARRDGDVRRAWRVHRVVAGVPPRVVEAMLFIGLPLLAVFAVGLVGGVPTVVRVAVPVATFVACCVWSASMRHRALSSALAERGRCGACAYPLDALPPEADRCTVCPECGAAWIVGRESGPGAGR